MRAMLEDAHCRARNKEHLPSKPFTRHNRLNSQRWVFVSEGLDDFKKVCSPYQGLATTQGSQKAFLPRIHPKILQSALKKGQHEWLTKAALFSKPSLASQTQKQLIGDREGLLATHPLALYPHLEEALPAELLLKVLEVLDPEKKLQETWAYCQDAQKRMKEPTALFKKPTRIDPRLSKKASTLHSGQWLYEEKPNVMGLLHEDSPRVHTKNVHEGVRDFCNWTTTLGIPDIHEEFILQQFDLDCQTCHLEPEKSKSMGRGDLQSTEFFQKPEQKKKLQKPQKSPKAKWVKMRYGAWYLHTHLWKKQRAAEPLLDPKVSCKAGEEQLRKELEKQEELLAHLYGTIAFKDFIINRGYKMPRFLEKIYSGKKGKSEFDKTPTKCT
ncbi:protein FAM47E [Thomomys bottae]